MRTNFFYGICFLTGAALTNAAENPIIFRNCGAGKDDDKLNPVEKFASEKGFSTFSDLEQRYLCHIVHRFAGSKDAGDGGKIAALLDDLEYRIGVREHYKTNATFTSKYCPSPSREIDVPTLKKFESIASRPSKTSVGIFVERNLNRVDKGALCWQLRRLDRNPQTKGDVTQDLALLENRVKSLLPSKAGFYAWKDEILGNVDASV